MRSATSIALICMLALAVSVASAQTAAGDTAAQITRYDANRDAAADLARARTLAASQHKRVLLLVGGDWCKDCRELDRVFAQNADLAALRERRFVLVKVFVGSENRNEAVLAPYPKIDWVPTLIELDERGAVARMTPSTEFHQHEQLDPARIRRYLEAG